MESLGKPHGTISIHAPREGSDALGLFFLLGHELISIHAPREGSDRPLWRLSAGGKNFYPRSPRGERLPPSTKTLSYLYFYPRSPRGERPDTYAIIQSHKEISIHAPREGSDRCPNSF